jgi:excisionase family DNA binding protein
MSAFPKRGPRRPGTGNRDAARQSVDERLPDKKRGRPDGRHAAVEAMPPDSDDVKRRTGKGAITIAPARLSPLLTVAEVAEHLKVDPKTVRRAIKRGEMHFHYVGRQIRIPQDEVAVYLARRWR